MKNPRRPVPRRAFLATAGAGAVAALRATQPLGAAELTDDEKAHVKVVTDFCAAWSTRDLKKILPFLSDDCVYRMSETTPPVSGHAGVTERLGTWMETSQRIEFNILDTFAKFPGTVPTLFIMNYVQAQHIDLEFYDRFFKPGAYLPTHAEHMAVWH